MDFSKMSRKDTKDRKKKLPSGACSHSLCFLQKKYPQSFDALRVLLIF